MGYHLAPLDKLWDFRLRRLGHSCQLCPFTDSMTCGLVIDPCEPQALPWILTEITRKRGVTLSHAVQMLFYLKTLFSKQYFLETVVCQLLCK